jgi:hypothetical protein
MRTLTSHRSMSFDDLSVLAMQHPMTSEQDVRQFLMEEVKRGNVAIEGLKGKERTPQWSRGHVVRFTRT